MGVPNVSTHTPGAKSLQVMPAENQLSDFMLVLFPVVGGISEQSK